MFVSLILRNEKWIKNNISSGRETWCKGTIRHWISTSHRNKSHVLLRGSGLRNYNQVHKSLWLCLYTCPNHLAY